MNGDLRILHVSKFPPSPSGVALYADRFDLVLAHLGSVRRLVAPAAPRDSQTFRAAARGFWHGWRAPADVLVHVELSGRGLFELYAGVGRAVRRRAPRLVLTCHDAPSVAGAVMMFTVVDRRGLRRVGAGLSRVLGEPVQRWLVERSDVVLALTEEGAASLAAAFSRPVEHLPHVVDDAPVRDKEPLVFIPGYVSDVERIVEVVRAVATAPDLADRRWSVLVGAGPDHVRSAVLERLPAELHLLVDFTGQLDENALLDIYGRSSVVVRLTGSAPAANWAAASGPLCWAVSRGCLALTDDDRSGARELEEWGLVTRTSRPAAVLADLLRSGSMSVESARKVGAAAEARMGVDAVAARYRRVISAALVGSAGSSDPPQDVQGAVR